MRVKLNRKENKETYRAEKRNMHVYTLKFM